MPNQPATDSHHELVYFQEPLRRWFSDTFDAPTAVQAKAWPLIAEERNTLLLAPTGSGKTLAAFLVAINRIMFETQADRGEPGVRVLKLRYFRLNHTPVLYSEGKAAMSRRFSLAMPPGVFNRSERYFSSRPSHS